MDTIRTRKIKRAGTALVAGLILLSVGLMLLGGLVPRKWAFEAGVFGFQLFPIALLAVLVRIILPIILGTSPGRALVGALSPVVAGVGGAIAWLWSPRSPEHGAANQPIRPQEQQADTGDNVVLDHLLYHENPEVGINPMEFIPEDPILRPNEYRPNFGDMFGDDS